MTKKGFFVMLVKIFGLYSLITTLFTVIPMMFSYSQMGFNLQLILFVLITAFLTIGLFVLLLFKSQIVVSKLKLDQGFDGNKIDVSNFGSKSIIKLSCLLMGGYLIISYIPSLLSHFFFFMKYDIAGILYKENNHFEFAMSILNILIGYLLLTNYKSISKLLDR